MRLASASLHSIRMKLVVVVVVVACMLAAARADCKVCVAGQCYIQTTLIYSPCGLHGTNAMDIDRNRQLLYLRISPNITMELCLGDSKINVIKTPNTWGLAFHQTEQVLYTFSDTAWYKHPQGSHTFEETKQLVENKNASMFLFNKNLLIFTEKGDKGLRFIDNNIRKSFRFLVNYTITDFVFDKRGHIYFVADDNVYHTVESEPHTVVVTKKKHVLSTDKYGGIYLGDPTINVIYKVNDETHQLDKYATYNSGSVDKFLFDDDNNIVFHDATDGSVNQWKPGNTKCSIEPPSAKYFFKEVIDNSCN